jgi:hypothetical protein
MQRQTCLNDTDARAFSQALAEAFPRIRFLSFHYDHNREYVDGVGWQLKDPIVHKIPYRDSLGEPEERRYWAWVQPKGWRPRWEGPNAEKGFRIANTPRLNFVFEKSVIPLGRATDLTEGRMWAFYDRDDKEHLSFLNKVWRICAKMTTNVLDSEHWRTGPKRSHNVKGPWVGPDAMRWCRENPKRRLGARYMPQEKPESG